MNPPILNRDFQHPADGWYDIEVPGEHPNQSAGIVQVIDDKAIASIVSTFNREADQPGFAGMLIDIDHLKHDEAHDTRAYGWLMRLRNRDGRPQGQIRWTGTGQAAVDEGDFRFFSSEYDPKDMEPVNNSNNPQSAIRNGKSRLDRVSPYRHGGSAGASPYRSIRNPQSAISGNFLRFGNDAGRLLAFRQPGTQKSCP